MKSSLWISLLLLTGCATAQNSFPSDIIKIRVEASDFYEQFFLQALKAEGRYHDLALEDSYTEFDYRMLLEVKEETAYRNRWCSARVVVRTMSDAEALNASQAGPGCDSAISSVARVAVERIARLRGSQ